MLRVAGKDTSSFSVSVTAPRSLEMDPSYRDWVFGCINQILDLVVQLTQPISNSELSHLLTFMGWSSGYQQIKFSRFRLTQARFHAVTCFATG